MNQKLKEVRPEFLVKPRSANLYRTKIQKYKVIIEMANVISHKEEDITIEVVSSVSFKPKLLKGLVLTLFQACVDYQEKYKIDIGFNLNKKSTDTEPKNDTE